MPAIPDQGVWASTRTAMKTRLFRAAVVGAAAAFLIGGASLASAGSPTATATPPPATSAQPVEMTGPDTDAIQQGDQTTLDQAPANASASVGPAETPDASPEASAATETDSAADAPGGHQDAPGQNVDHQFQGEE
jgi:hypothetical protein